MVVINLYPFARPNLESKPMRRLRTSIFLSGLLIASPALAQGVQPEDVKLDDQPAAQAPAAKPPAAQPPAAQANANATVGATANAVVAANKEEKQEKAEETKEKAKEDTRAATGTVSGPVTEGDDTWKFSYNGYFRAPMRVGIGSRTAGAGQSSMTLHSPLVPDDQYLSWQHTKHANRDWAELFLSYGNSWAKGVVAIQGYNFVDAGSADWHANFGVGQGWIEITPYMPAENIRLKIKGGSFWNRYGSAGRYDAGEYDTFLFGRTHAMGETTRLEIDLEGQPITLGFEHGIGTKKPDPSIYNTARFTLLHHMHADIVYDQSISFGLHFLDSFSQSEPLVTGPQPSWVYPGPAVTQYQGINQPDCSMKIFGADARFDMPDVFGYLWAGVSYIDLKNAVTVAPAVEVIHSDGGGEYNMGVTGNYLDSDICRWQSAGDGRRCSGGNGGVLTVAAQYEEKVGDLLGESPFGEGQDLTIKLYGMWNKIKSQDPLQDGVSKLKFGTDWIFDVFPVMAVAARFDYLMPNSHFKPQNFGILSPRIVLRSNFATHEQLAFQYSRYLYSARTCPSGTPADNSVSAYSFDPANGGTRVDTPFPGGNALAPTYAPGTPNYVTESQCVQPPPSVVTPDGWGASTQNQDPRLRGMPYTGAQLRPDVNVFTVEASMWW